MIIYLVPILIALTMITAAAGIYQVYAGNRRVAARLRRVVDDGDAGPREDDLDGRPLPVWLRPFTLLAWLLPGHIYSETLEWELAQAGHRHSAARQVFAGLRVVSIALHTAVTIVLAWALHLSPQEIVLLGAVAAAAGYFVPMMVLRYQQSKRQMEITLALPDALDLLVICVEAGQGLNAALLKVGKESQLQSHALSDELRTVNNEIRAGIPRAQALRNFALRTGVDDVRSLVAVMIQSDRFGTSISQALRVHSDSLRTRRRQRAEERARKAPVKLVFPLVFCIFPELLVVILAPGMLDLFRALAKVSSG